MGFRDPSSPHQPAGIKNHRFCLFRHGRGWGGPFTLTWDIRKLPLYIEEDIENRFNREITNSRLCVAETFLFYFWGVVENLGSLLGPLFFKWGGLGGGLFSKGGALLKDILCYLLSLLFLFLVYQEKIFFTKQ